MADDQFKFEHKISREAALKAVYAVEHKKWEKADPAKRDPEPDLAKYMASNADLNGREIVLAYATTGRITDIPEAGQPGLNAKEGKALGAVLLAIEKDEGNKRPDVKIKGADGHTYHLEPKEFAAYLQHNEKGLPVDQWREQQNIGLTGHGSKLKNGHEKLLIETHDGEHRTVSNGVITEPLKGYYGGVKGVEVGDHDLLDVYISPSIYKEIAAGKPYTGHVFVMQQLDKGKPDELKVGYAKDVDEFADIQRSTWKPRSDFDKQNQGKYAELTQEQYADLKAAIKKTPGLTLDAFLKTEQEQGINIATATPKPAAEEKKHEAAAPAPATKPQVVMQPHQESAQDQLSHTVAQEVYDKRNDKAAVASMESFITAHGGKVDRDHAHLSTQERETLGKMLLDPKLAEDVRALGTGLGAKGVGAPVAATGGEHAPKSTPAEKGSAVVGRGGM
jgi:hypothetical protein